MENVRNKNWFQRYVHYTRKFALSDFVVSGVDCIYGRTWGIIVARAHIEILELSTTL